MIRAIRTSVLVLVLAAQLCGCTTVTPRRPAEIAKEFYCCAVRKDYPAAERLLSECSKKVLAGPFGQHLYGLAGAIRKSSFPSLSGFDRFEIIDETVKGDEAMVSARLLFPNTHNDA